VAASTQLILSEVWRTKRRQWWLADTEFANVRWIAVKFPRNLQILYVVNALIWLATVSSIRRAAVGVPLRCSQ
jgi:hypothetical protein